MLILDPVTLLILLVLMFLVDSLGTSTRSRHLRIEVVSLLPSQYKCLLFHVLMNCCARVSSTMLSRSGESGHPCLVPDLIGKVFSLLPLSVMLAEGFS